jgi:hypothetical protein
MNKLPNGILSINTYTGYLLSRTSNSGSAHTVQSMAAGIRGRVRLCEIYGERSGTGAPFLLVLRFPLPMIPPTAPHSSSSSSSSSFIWGWYSRPNSGLRTKWARSHSTFKTKTSTTCFRLITSGVWCCSRLCTWRPMSRRTQEPPP